VPHVTAAAQNAETRMGAVLKYVTASRACPVLTFERPTG
jgi:hypothetical protein